MRELFCAHEKSFTGSVVPAASFLLKFFAGFQRANLPLNLIRKRAPHTADRVHVFDLNLHPEPGLFFWSNRNIAVATELSFFHLGIADSAVNQNLLERCEKRERFLWRIDFRLRDNLHQWRAGAVEIDAGAVFKVETFRHVFLEVNAHEMHFLVRRDDIFLRVLRISEVV